MTLIQTVLVFSALAASVSALGALPLRRRPGGLSNRTRGWLNALASGLMLGAAYVLTQVGLDPHPVSASVGALIGITFLFWSHRVSRIADTELRAPDGDNPVYGYKVLLVSTLHSIPEGVAIGTAMIQSRALGIFMVTALAVHNLPEATNLSASLRGWGLRLSEAAGLSVTVRIPQVLMAVVTVALVLDAPSLLPWAAGFAVGALVYLVMVELLPESYREAGPVSIAVVASVAMSMVVLLHGLVP